MKANVHPDLLPKGGSASRDVLILGIGNILWADEGFGPRAAEAFHQRYETPAGVEVMDGGTLGGWLLDEILSTRRMLVFDCCDFKEKPGTLKVLQKSDVKIWSSTKISPHQTGFNDLLASAAILGYELEDLAVVGIQPELLDDYGGSLSPLIRSRLDEAVELGAKFLEEWGVKLTPRPAGAKAAPLSFSVLELNEYEAGRPDAKEACRYGDERFLVRTAGHAVENPEETK